MVWWSGKAVRGPRRLPSSRADAGGVPRSRSLRRAPRTPPTRDPGSQGLSELPSSSQLRRSWRPVLKTRGRAAWPQAWGWTVPVEPRSCGQSQASEESQWASSGGGATMRVDLWARAQQQRWEEPQYLLEARAGCIRCREASGEERRDRSGHGAWRGAAVLTRQLRAESGRGLQGGCEPPSESRRGPGRWLS